MSCLYQPYEKERRKEGRKEEKRREGRKLFHV
jgi:hypothetical protein